MSLMKIQENPEGEKTAGISELFVCFFSRIIQVIKKLVCDENDDGEVEHLSQVALLLRYFDDYYYEKNNGENDK